MLSKPTRTSKVTTLPYVPDHANGSLLYRLQQLSFSLVRKEENELMEQTKMERRGKATTSSKLLTESESSYSGLGEAIKQRTSLARVAIQDPIVERFEKDILWKRN